ncbi:MAG: Ig-like domain-containing protein, partial [Kiloniellales bacterium]
MTEATDLQFAQTSDETEDAAEAEGRQPTEAQPGQADAAQEVPVSRPAAGETAVIEAAPAARYVIAFDPNEAQVQIDGNDFILLFGDGGRIVFANLVLLASSEQPPSLLVGGTTIGGNLIVAQAQSLAGQQPTLETTAGNQPGQQVAGGSHAYDDNLGSLIAPLQAQPDIPYVEREFRLIDLEPITPTPLIPTPLEATEPVIPALFALPMFGTVSEQFLPPRSPAGSQFDLTGGPGVSSDPSTPNVAFSGSLAFDRSNGGVVTALQLSDGTVVAPVGAGGASVTVTYDGYSFGPITAEAGDFLFTTPLGNVLFVDHETGEYLYVLADNEVHSGVGSSGANDTVEEIFTYRVTDSFDQAATSTLTIDIQDDAPTAVDEALLKVYDGGTVIGPGSVLENDTEGADGTGTVASIGVTGDAADQVAIGSTPVSIAGTYGTLTINELGEYSYTANDLGNSPPANPVDTFVYTIIDQDGDSAQAAITILVKEDPTGGLAVAAGQ